MTPCVNRYTRGYISRQIFSTIQNTFSVIIGFMTLLYTYLFEMGISFDELAAVLQIRNGNRDNFGIFIYIFH